MAEEVEKRMSVAEFLAWDSGTDRVFELIDGVPVMMAPGSKWHAQIAQNLSGLIDRTVESRRPCRAVQQGGIEISPGPPARVFVLDVLMTCESLDERELFEAPRLIVEVLSRTTRSYDKRHKVPLYGELPSVEEIWLVDAGARWLQIYERLAAGWHGGLPLIGQATFASRVLGVTVSLDDIYRLTALATSSPDDLDPAAPL